MTGLGSRATFLITVFVKQSIFLIGHIPYHQGIKYATAFNGKVALYKGTSQIYCLGKWITDELNLSVAPSWPCKGDTSYVYATLRNGEEKTTCSPVQTRASAARPHSLHCIQPSLVSLEVSLEAGGLFGVR